MILETDPQSITSRVLMRGVEGTQPITDMSMSQAIATAKDQLFKSEYARPHTGALNRPPLQV